MAHTPSQFDTMQIKLKKLTITSNEVNEELHKQLKPRCSNSTLKRNKHIHQTVCPESERQVSKSKIKPRENLHKKCKVTAPIIPLVPTNIRCPSFQHKDRFPAKNECHLSFTKDKSPTKPKDDFCMKGAESPIKESLICSTDSEYLCSKNITYPTRLAVYGGQRDRTPGPMKHFKSKEVLRMEYKHRPPPPRPTSVTAKNESPYSDSAKHDGDDFQPEKMQLSSLTADKTLQVKGMRTRSYVKSQTVLCEQHRHRPPPAKIHINDNYSNHNDKPTDEGESSSISIPSFSNDHLATGGTEEDYMPLIPKRMKKLITPGPAYETLNRY